MPRAGSSASITTSAKAVFQCDSDVRANGLDSGGLVTAPGDGAPCKVFRVEAPLSNTDTILVSVQPLHKSTEFVPIAAGGMKEWIGVRGSSIIEKIEKVLVKSNSGTQSAYYDCSGA